MPALNFGINLFLLDTTICRIELSSLSAHIVTQNYF